MAAHVVIIGGGFGGLYAARELSRRPLRVTLVDRRNHHLFQPLLYQVATAALSPADIATPLRHILSARRNVTVFLAEVERVDLDARKVVLTDGELRYDAVIVAAGVSHSYFGHDEWELAAPGLKSLEDALEIRRRVLLAYEAAERCEDATERQALLRFVVIGGGPTGVELAGALAEISRKTVAADFRVIDPTQAHILLLEAGPRGGAERLAPTGRPPDRALQLPGQGEHRDDRPRLRGGRRPGASPLRFRRLARLAPRAHLLPDRFPEPVRRPLRVGVGLLDVSARGAAHHGAPRVPHPRQAGVTARRRPYGLKTSTAMTMAGLSPVFSAQCRVSFPSVQLSPSRCSATEPPSRCSIRV